MRRATCSCRSGPPATASCPRRRWRPTVAFTTGRRRTPTGPQPGPASRSATSSSLSISGAAWPSSPSSGLAWASSAPPPPQFRPGRVVVIFALTAHHAYRFMQNTGIPYIGIFPIEADPLVHPSDWTITIDTMDAALCESEFGTTLLRDAGIKARHFPVGIDSEFWRPPTAEERQAARLAWNLPDRFVVFTVGDNHERKNLPVHYAAVSLLAGGV